MSPSPADRRAQVAAVFDRAADTYDAVGVDFFTPIGRALVAMAGLRPGDRVLDVGCGRGACLFPAADMVGRNGRVLGIDLAPGMVAATAADVASRGLGHVSVELRDAERPDLGPDSFDAILASLVLFFLPDPAAGLSAWAACLRPSGRLAITTFGPPDERWAVLDHVSLEHAGATGTTQPPGSGEGPFASVERLDALVAAAGFTNVQSDEQVQEVRYRNGAQWWESQWSIGARAVWERVPPDRLPAVREAAVQAASEAAGEPDGTLTWRPTIRFTTAIKA
ncbi:MAG: methyltransferase domain-containing protein [Frankiaceae bacterium]